MFRYLMVKILLANKEFMHGFKMNSLSRITYIETIGLIPIISVLFTFLRAISLILGINCLNLGEVALFSLLFLIEKFL